jgi:hypothetical protein
MPEPVSRRAALAAGLSGAAAVTLGARSAVAAEGPDPGPGLEALVRAEHDAAFVYRTAGLEGAAPLAEQEEQHARALSAHLQAVGVPPPGPRRSPSGLRREALAVLEAGGGAERLRAAAAYERTLIAGCAARLAPLEEPNIVRTIATVMASHAQHLALHERAAGLSGL